MKSNVNFSERAYRIKVSIAFLTCLLFLSLPGCEEIKTPEELLIGTWFMESIHVIEHVDEEKTADYTNNYDPYEYTILLQKDGTGKEYRFEGYGYYFSEDPFFWRITDGDSESCESILIFYRKDELGQEVHLSNLCFTVNESDLTLQDSREGECPPDLISKEGGSYSSGYWCNYLAWIILKRQ